MDDALELIHAGVVGDVPLCSEPRSDNEESCFGIAAICSLDLPFPLVRVEVGVGHYGAECTVFTEITHLVDMVEVRLQFMPVWIVGGPVPGIVDFGDC